MSSPPSFLPFNFAVCAPPPPPPSAILISNHHKHLANSRLNSRYATLRVTHPLTPKLNVQNASFVSIKLSLLAWPRFLHQNPPLWPKLPSPGITILFVADTIRTRSYHRAFWEEFLINLQTALEHLSWQIRRHRWASLGVSLIQAIKSLISSVNFSTLSDSSVDRRRPRSA
jgi:hypothetical protein